MRKKLFAIVMSMTMVASFMPSMAFAANTNDDKAGHTYYEYDTDYTIVDGKVKAKDEKKQEAIEKCVKVLVAPTCTTKGKVELTCKEPLPKGAACDQTKIQEINNEIGHHTYERVNMSLEDYAAQRVAQAKGATGDFENEGTAKAWVKGQKAHDVCYVYAKRCNSCGFVDELEEAAIDPSGISSLVKTAKSVLINHGCDADTAKATCAEKVLCSNVGCSVMIDNPFAAPANPEDVKENERKGHVLDTKITTTKTGCDGITVTKQACKDCDYVKVETTGKANCVEFKGEIPSSSVRKSKKESETNYLYNGKVIATEGGTGNITAKPGYYYDETNGVFVKADTTVKIGTTEYFGYTCKHCGYVRTLNDVKVESAVCNHAWKKVTEEATCEAPAQEYMVCTECGKYKTVKQDDDVAGSATKVTTAVEGSKKLGHNYVATKVDGDCHDTVKYTIECTRENCPHEKPVAPLKDEVTRAEYVGLDKGTSLYLDPADGSVGQKNIVGSQELPYIADDTANNHKFTKKVTLKAATCTNNELVGYVCDTCGKINVHSATVVPSTMLAHTFVKNEVAATCGTAGYYTEKCSTCGFVKNDLGDLVDPSTIDGKTPATTAKKTETDKALVKDGAKCTFDKWVVTKASTVFEEGVKTLTCSVCGAHDATKTVIAKAKYAAPAVKAGKKSATVTVKATADAAKYQISYKKAGGSYKTISAKVGKKTIKKLAKGKKYTFKVIAINAEGVKVASATKTVKVK